MQYHLSIVIYFLRWFSIRQSSMKCHHCRLCLSTGWVSLKHLSFFIKNNHYYYVPNNDSLLLLMQVWWDEKFWFLTWMKHLFILIMMVSSGRQSRLEAIFTQLYSLCNIYSSLYFLQPGTPPDFVLKVTIDRHPVRFFVHKRPHVDYFLEVVRL